MFMFVSGQNTGDYVHFNSSVTYFGATFLIS